MDDALLSDLKEDNIMAVIYLNVVTRNEICVNQNKTLFLCGRKKFKLQHANVHNRLAIAARAELGI